MAIALVLLVGFLVRDLAPVPQSSRRASCRTRTRATRWRRSSCRRRRASSARRRSPSRSTRSSRSMPGVATRTVITGYSLLDSGFKTNAGTFFVTFTDFEERYKNVEHGEAAERARDPAGVLRRSAEDREARSCIPIAPPAIPGIGTTGGFEFWIQDTGDGRPVAARRRHAGLPAQGARAAGADGPRHHLLAPTRSSCARTSTATRRTLLGIPIQDVYSAIQAQFGSLTVSQYNQFSRTSGG